MSRVSARKDKDFVVFLIGMRVNKWWNIPDILQAGMAMPRMLKELHANPQSGFLGAEGWGGRTSIMVQYWESFEKLEAFANDRQMTHYPAWVEFYKRAKKSNNAVGVWHETYLIKKGQYESIYANMPSFGLGKVLGLENSEGQYFNARKRINEHE
ncbi:DUF4188 domain-containing protein [Jiulongibacter sp. NS-SX5]|uniref:DUF4188 domain-containing protein n=1 Tax=Jiulongibacter sp. NS-SX5 TaxID=3463854 RepID=UPI00405926B2